MRQVVWSDWGKRQYRSAMMYLIPRNPVAAGKLAAQIRATIEGLAERPIGRPGHAPGTFEKIVPKTRYIVIYELMGDELHIHRLFHMSQDWRGWRERDQ